MEPCWTLSASKLENNVEVSPIRCHEQLFASLQNLQDTFHQLSENGGVSILAPLRSQDKNGGSGRTGRQGDGRTEDNGDDDRHVCTAQAIVGALAALGLSHDDAKDTLAITKIKVELIRRYRGKVET